MSSLLLSAREQSATATAEGDLAAAIETLAGSATRFARLGPGEKADLLEACLPLLLEAAPRWAEAGCVAKGIDPATPLAGEEWLAGPVTTIRNVRLLTESLRQIQSRGTPPFGRGLVARADGRLEVKVFPTGAMDSLLFSGFTATHLYPEGVTEAAAREQQAAFYKQTDPEGGVSLILGAGNVSSIPPMDALYKSFVEGFCCVIKMNPVNEYIGPFIEETFRPLVDAGFWRVVYGGAKEGAFLVEHEAVVDIHITGSDRTHDRIVWGPADEQAERKAKGEPALAAGKRMTSELGNVTPVVIVPGAFTEAELEFTAQSIVAMVQNNGSFNCNAAKMLVTAKGWPQREALLDTVKAALDRVPARKAYYPGASDRYEALLEGKDDVWYGSCDRDDGLRWAFVTGVPADREDERLFDTEPFCAMLSEAVIDESEPAAFLAQATAFCNDRIWGTLSMTIVCPPQAEKQPSVAAALEQAIIDLRYGTVAINHWSGLGYGFVSSGWGGHPSATLEDIQSGLGWVHNTYMLDGFDKAVIRGPLIVKPKPAWFFGHKTCDQLGRKLAILEAKGGWLRLPGLIATALRG